MLWMLLVFSPCYLPPVVAPIAVPFEAPACDYCPGQRGIEYHVVPGTRVHAASAGTVTFNGVVAGTRYVVVLHADGLRATYGQLASSRVDRSDAVIAGEMIATSSNVLYFGLRNADDDPLDPASYLATVARRARLVPVNGSPARPPVTRTPTCPKVAESARGAR